MLWFICDFEFKYGSINSDKWFFIKYNLVEYVGKVFVYFF